MTSPETLFYVDSHSCDQMHEVLIGYFQTRSHLVFGSKGLEQYRTQRPGHLAPEDGAFVVALDRGAKWEITTDVTGQELLYLYRASGFWAISNSLYCLATEVRRKGCKLTPRMSSLSAFATKDGNHWAAQPFSLRTIFNEITLLPSTASVKVNRATRSLSVESRSLFEVLEGFEDVSYEDLIAEFVNSAVAEVRGLGAVPGLGMRCQLSGGYDSRITYGLFLAANLPADSYVVESSKGKWSDFSVAQGLAAQFGQQLNAAGAGSGATADADEVYELWKMGSFGSYLPIYTVKHMSPRFSIKARGDLWTSTKFYKGSSCDVVRRVEKELGGARGAAVAQDFWDGMADIGLDAHGESSMVMHYSAFRSRFHCGRRWYKNLGHQVLYGPLVSRHLGAAAVKASRRGWDERRLSMDLLSALGNGLAAFRFDQEGKNFRASELRESPFYGGIQVASGEKKVYWGAGSGQESGRRGGGLSEAGMRERLLDEYKDVMDAVKRSKVLPENVFERAAVEKKDGGSLSHGARMITLVLFAAFALGIE
ncbi:hypothetical protein [Thioalkalivibrio sp. ALJ16]|uniref:hypothetical protein n=1 Tax=Thioalkalivibrio sp. ALJ16 TaxID=1158762 RepID=UPI0003A5E98A|nr:hypothetical protein [Thioalkalivibrio sp. ALJ16]